VQGTSYEPLGGLRLAAVTGFPSQATACGFTAFVSLFRPSFWSLFAFSDLALYFSHHLSCAAVLLLPLVWFCLASFSRSILFSNWCVFLDFVDFLSP
jgi:hypothetical protein